MLKQITPFLLLKRYVFIILIISDIKIPLLNIPHEIQNYNTPHIPVNSCLLPGSINNDTITLTEVIS